MRSESELRSASGYTARPRDFDDLIGILDSELRLITPTDPEGLGDEVQTAKEGQRYYQLSHDYLVHSLHDWLNRKQRETRRGRAELLLAERAAIWDAKPETRHLPSLWEWTTIRTLTPAKDWSEPQKRMMRRAGRVHGLRAIASILVAVGVLALGLSGWRRVAEADEARAGAARSLVQQLLKVDTSLVGDLVGALGDYRRWADPELKRIVAEPWAQPKAKLHASLALLPVDSGQVPYLQTRLLAAAPEELLVLCEALLPHRAKLVSTFWETLESAHPGDPSLLRSAGALAMYDRESPRWADLARKVAEELVAADPAFYRTWLEAFRPVRDSLTGSLVEIFRDRRRAATEHSVAANVLAEYAVDEPRLLSDLLLEADPARFRTLFRVAERQGEKILPFIRDELARKPPDGEGWEQAKHELAGRQARAALALARLGKTEVVWPLFRHCPEPELRSLIINWSKPLGVDCGVLAAEFQRLTARSAPTTMDEVLFDQGIAIQRALVLALGTFESDDVPPGVRDGITGAIVDLFRKHPDAGIHAAAEWTLHRWKQQKAIDGTSAELPRLSNKGDHRWYVNGQGQTFAVIEGPVEFSMGSPLSDGEREAVREPQRRVRILRRFSIATKEVTVEQFHRFLRDNPNPAYSEPEDDVKRLSPDPSGPWLGPNWYAAAHYCNWLSKQEGLPEDQYCYIPNTDKAYAEGMTIPANSLERMGYRLPTEAEWEYTCRAGTTTSRYYGNSIDLLGNYARYQPNSQEHAWPGGSLFPNDLGLFDMLGNVYEWCLDQAKLASPAGKAITLDIVPQESITDRGNRILRGGAFYMGTKYARSADRAAAPATDVSTLYGFRVARTLP
jgi:formylglycine-generating enzyme required for sulfatase activity